MERTRPHYVEHSEGRSCETCQAFGVRNGSPICRARPPSVQSYSVPVPTQNGMEIRTITVTAWPEISPNEWCREWGQRRTDA